MGYDQSLYIEEESNMHEQMLRSYAFDKYIAEAYRNVFPSNIEEIREMNEDCIVQSEITPELAFEIVKVMNKNGIKLHYQADW